MPRDRPRTLPGSLRLGVSQGDLEKMKAGGAAGAARAAEVEKNLEGTLHHFLYLPESADDLADLREEVLTDLYGDGPRDEKVADYVRDVLSEMWFIKRNGDMTSSRRAVAGDAGTPTAASWEC